MYEYRGPARRPAYELVVHLPDGRPIQLYKFPCCLLIGQAGRLTIPAKKDTNPESVLRFVLKDLDSCFSHPPTSYSNVYP
eukprot:COSAG01_NODE_7323_length_3251_cov_1.566624_6_plen_79_part_01